MPRKDYEQFLREFKGSEQFKLLNPAKEPHYYYTFAKVVDLRTRMVEDETEGFEIGVFMDVFPVDYVTDNLQERERVFKLKKLLYKIRRCKISNSNPLQSSLAYIVYKYLPLSVKQIERKIRRLIVLEEPTHTVCNMTEAGPKIKGCFPAADIATSIDIEFEGKLYKTMVGYKDYLERTYGDYMTLPPVEQRVTHKFEAYWL
jgi:lipopolysaccharide cholinephosphotransferase